MKNDFKPVLGHSFNLRAEWGVREFGAIGNGISFAIGVAAARKDGKTVLNDGAYGSEIHKLRADGVDDSGSVFGRTDIAAIAKGFGLRGANITDVKEFKPLFEAYQAQDTAEIWNIHVSDEVVSPSTRRTVGRGHGKM